MAYARPLSCVLQTLQKTIDITGWRQHEHLLKKVKQTARQIGRISTRKGAKYTRNDSPSNTAGYWDAPRRYSRVPKQLVETLENEYELDLGFRWHALQKSDVFMETYGACLRHGTSSCSRRRGQFPTSEKLFSIFEPHTQLYQTRQSRPASINSDAWSWSMKTLHGLHFPSSRYATRCARTKTWSWRRRRSCKTVVNNQIEEASFDRGFHSPENQEQLAEIVKHLCLPKPGSKQSVEQNGKRISQVS